MVFISVICQATHTEMSSPLSIVWRWKFIKRVSISIQDKALIFGFLSPSEMKTMTMSFHLHQCRWKFIKHVLISMRVKDLIIEFSSPTDMKTMEMSFYLYQWIWKFIKHVLISVRVKDLIIGSSSPTEVKTVKMSFHLLYGFWTNTFSSLRVETMICMSLSPEIKTSIRGFDLWKIKTHKVRFARQR